MQVCLLKSKIHRAWVTSANVNYEGSLSIDGALMERAGILPFEKILCGNLDNGERFETYAIPGEPGTGAVVLNGATAHRGKVGDRLTIMCFAWFEEQIAMTWRPRVIVLGERNVVIHDRGI